MNLLINSKNYKVKFGYGAFRRVCEHYKLKKVSGFNDLIVKFKLDKMDDPTFDQLAVIGNLVVAGIKCADDSADVTSDDVIDVLWKDQNGLAAVFEEFTKSMPKGSPEPQGK